MTLFGLAPDRRPVRRGALPGLRARTYPAQTPRSAGRSAPVIDEGGRRWLASDRPAGGRPACPGRLSRTSTPRRTASHVAGQEGRAPAEVAVKNRLPPRSRAGEEDPSAKAAARPRRRRRQEGGGAAKAAPATKARGAKAAPGEESRPGQEGRGREGRRGRRLRRRARASATKRVPRRRPHRPKPSPARRQPTQGGPGQEGRRRQEGPGAEAGRCGQEGRR